MDFLRQWICALVCAGLSWTARANAGPYLHDLGATRVELRVETEPPRAVEVSVQRAGDPQPRRVSDKEGAFHAITLDKLEPKTRYTYVVGEARGEFVTAPAETSLEPFTTLVYGDNRTDDQAHAAVVAAMLRTPSDFLLHTGDLIDDARKPRDWARFFSIEEPLIGSRCLFSTIGNHDLLDDGARYARYFGPPNVTMRWQFVRFFFVNAMDSSPWTWLPTELHARENEPGVIWRVVVLHHGPFASGPHGSNTAIPPSALDGWRASGVDLVLSGHDHIYERGLARGLRYVVSGGGGAPPYPIEAKLPSARKVESSRHFVELRFAPEDVRLAARRAEGTTIEEVSFTRDRAWSDEAPLARVAESKPAPPEAAPAASSSSAWIAPAVVFGVLALLLGSRFLRKRE